MKHLKVYLMLLGFAIFTGASFNLAKYTVNYLSPITAAAWRFGCAAVILFFLLLFTEGVNKAVVKRNLIWYIVLGIVGIFGFSTLFFAGLSYTSSVNGSLIMGLNPLLTIIFARFLLNDKITKEQIIGTVLAFIGVLFVITQGSMETVRSLSFSIGDIIIFAGNICWALYGVLGRRFIHNGTALSTTTYTMMVGAIGLIAVSFFSSNPVPLANLPLGVWGAIGFMAIFTSVLGYLWWNIGMKEIGASKTSLFFNLVPVVTMIISFFIGEQVSSPQLLGAVCVILGVLLSSGAFSLKKASEQLDPNI